MWTMAWCRATMRALMVRAVSWPLRSRQKKTSCRCWEVTFVAVLDAFLWCTNQTLMHATIVVLPHDISSCHAGRNGRADI